MMEKRSLFKEFTKGIVKENPVLCLVLGTCPTLAVTTSATNAIGMGVAATLVLVCSNAVISALRKVIPDKVRIPAYITIIAGFVTIAQMLVKAFAPAINNSLGIYLPLIVVNCIILGRAEMYAGKNPVVDPRRTGDGRRLYGGALVYGYHPRAARLGLDLRVPTDARSDIDLHPASRRLLRLWHIDHAGKQAEHPRGQKGQDHAVRRLSDGGELFAEGGKMR